LEIKNPTLIFTRACNSYGKNHNLKYNMTPRKTSRRKAPRRKMQKSRRMNRKNIVKQRGGMLSESQDANTVAKEEYGVDLGQLSPSKQAYCIAAADWNRRNESASTNPGEWRPTQPW
jgi:hypothetical protein